MFVVEKAARGHRYLYLVESVREPGGRARQRILQPLGRKDLLAANGGLDRCCSDGCGSRLAAGR